MDHVTSLARKAQTRGLFVFVVRNSLVLTVLQPSLISPLLSFSVYIDFIVLLICWSRRPNRSVGGGWGKVLVGTGIGWFVGGKIHAQRKEKKLNKKHKEEQKALYTQYYNDVYSLQTQNAELAQALEQMGVKLRWAFTVPVLWSDKKYQSIPGFFQLRWVTTVREPSVSDVIYRR